MTTKSEVRFGLITERKEKLDAIADGMGYDTSAFLMMCYDFFLEHSYNPDLKQAISNFNFNKTKKGLLT